MTDEYAAWRTLEGPTHFGCLAHARRNQAGGPHMHWNTSRRSTRSKHSQRGICPRARRALITPSGCASNTACRCSNPSGNGLTNWHQILPESLLGKAISYTRNQWTYLSRYVNDGLAPIDNNVIERDIRPFCTGRSSRLFSDTVAGAKARAMIYSLMLTCRACNVEPYAYLVRVLSEVPQRALNADVTDLLPFNISKPTA
jgi:transposase